MLLTFSYSDSFQLQCKMGERVLYHCILSDDNTDMIHHFDDVIVEGGHRELGTHTVHIGLLTPANAFDQLEIVCDSEVFISVVAYTTHVITPNRNQELCTQHYF